MNVRSFAVAVAGAAVLAVSAPAIGHHAVAAEFDTHKPISFTGTVKKVEWSNPHIYTQVEVKNPDGTTVVYRVEGGAPNSLFRQGWRRDTIKPGDVVTVNGLRAKNDQSMNVGQATIITSDGHRVFGQSGGGGGGGAQ